MSDQPVPNRLAAWNRDNVCELQLQAESSPPNGYIEHNHPAARLNAIAEYGFTRSRPLFKLADTLAKSGGILTLNAEEVRTLAEGFETMAFYVGDGVVFDKPPKPSFLSRIVEAFTSRSKRLLPQT